VYAPVPPEGVTVAEALFPPLQSSSVCENAVTICVGSVTVAEAVAVHPFASVTVHV
jgi:hypothetical protein